MPLTNVIAIITMPITVRIVPQPDFDLEILAHAKKDPRQEGRSAQIHQAPPQAAGRPHRARRPAQCHLDIGDIVKLIEK
jgi:hypothetical protein